MDEEEEESSEINKKGTERLKTQFILPDAVYEVTQLLRDAGLGTGWITTEIQYITFLKQGSSFNLYTLYVSPLNCTKELRISLPPSMAKVRDSHVFESVT